MADDGDLTFMNATEPVFGAQAGLTLMHVHGPDCPDEHPGDEGGACPYPHLEW